MKLFRAFKTELDPNNHQRTLLLKHAGAARFVYNWGLRRKIESYESTGRTPTAIDLHRELNALKKTDFPWLYDVSKCSPQEALRNLDRAYLNFFRRSKQQKKGGRGFPKFKSRKKAIGSFSLFGSIRVFDNAVQLPRLGRLRLKEHGYLPEHGWKILRAIVSEKAGRWFVSLQVEQDVPDPISKDGDVLGVDVGVKYSATLSDGTSYNNPRALYSAERRLRMLQKRISRRVEGGKNRAKAINAVAKQHYRVACIRKDALHKATSAIVKRVSVVGIETLDISSMMKNHYLAKAIGDASMAEFHRMLKYKMKWSGGTVVEADQWFPSSKMCSSCSYVNKDIILGIGAWTCPICESKHDRDKNAALNLKNMAGSSPVTAYCPGSSSRVNLDKTTG